MKREYNYLYFLRKYLEVELTLMAPCINALEKENPDDKAIELLDNSYTALQESLHQLKLAITNIENQLDQ